MKFEFECDARMDGFVLIDEGCLSELTEDMLCEMVILLDTAGESELICDYPGEEWRVVWARETKTIRAFCESGRMLLWLLNSTKTECEMEYQADIAAPSKWLYVPTGKLLAVTAGELVQCLLYPGLVMEKVFEMTIPKGWYAFASQSMERIQYCKGQPETTVFENIEVV